MHDYSSVQAYRRDNVQVMLQPNEKYVKGLSEKDPELSKFK